MIAVITEYSKPRGPVSYHDLKLGDVFEDADGEGLFRKIKTLDSYMYDDFSSCIDRIDDTFRESKYMVVGRLVLDIGRAYTGASGKEHTLTPEEMGGKQWEKEEESKGMDAVSYSPDPSSSPVPVAWDGSPLSVGVGDEVALASLPDGSLVRDEYGDLGVKFTDDENDNRPAIFFLTGWYTFTPNEGSEVTYRGRLVMQ